jgi:hypothetical protein
VHCPKEAIGELMGMVSFSYQGLAASQITPMISTAFYVEVQGTQKNAGEITALGAGTRIGQFQVGVQVKDTGNVRLRPAGTIQLLDNKGALVTEYLVPETLPIFPGQRSDLSGRGSNTPPPAGHYRLVANLHSGTLELKREQGITVNAKGDVEADKEATKS